MIYTATNNTVNYRGDGNGGILIGVSYGPVTVHSDVDELSISEHYLRFSTPLRL